MCEFVKIVFHLNVLFLSNDLYVRLNNFMNVLVFYAFVYLSVCKIICLSVLSLYVFVHIYFNGDTGLLYRFACMFMFV